MDGRVARAERSRRAIVAAHLALIDEGDLRPTGERIAERAGVSLRSLWTNFRISGRPSPASSRWPPTTGTGW
jgi:TetR/AcrR family transcriptional regulator, regulator of autoinduction and epiphytic fitness